MKKLSEFYQRLNHIHPVLLLAARSVIIGGICDDFDCCFRNAPAHVRAEC